MLLFGNKIRLSKCQWVLILILVSSPLYTMSIGSFNLYFLYMLLFVAIFIFHIRTNRKFAMSSSLKVFLIMLVFGLLLDMFLSDSPIQSNKVFILTFLILLYPTDQDTTKIIYPVLAFTGIAFGLYMINNPQYIANVRLSVKVGDWVMDPNWAAMAVFPTFCYGLFLFEKSFLFKVLSIIICLFAVYVDFLTGSRGSLVSLGAASIAFFFFKMRFSFSTVLFVAVVGVIVYIVDSYFLSTVDQTLLDRYNGTIGDTNRSHAWSGLMKGFLESNFWGLLFGHGSGSTVNNLGFAAHNIFLEHLYVRGLLGVVLLVVFLYKFLKETLICRNHIGLCIIIALITCSMFTPVWGGVYMMMPLAAVGYVNNFYSKNIKIQKSNENCNSIHMYR